MTADVSNPDLTSDVIASGVFSMPYVIDIKYSLACSQILFYY